jgi:SPW repeat
MTAFRLISLPAHGAVELLVGLALMASPFVLGFTPAATLVAVLAGAVIAGLALGAAVADTGTIDIAAHYTYDLGLSVGLLGAALVFALDGDGPAGGALLGAGVAQLALNLTTRYSARR